MSKVAEYLQGHISGEVSTRADVREAMSMDASPLRVIPEMVAYPRSTNDVRKIARFSWQLAEQGHILPITARGGGTDQTGAAISNGVSMVMTAHMNRIFEYEPKQRLVRLQPGAYFKALNDSLWLHGVMVPGAPVSAAYSTVGGAIANNASGPLTGKYGRIGNWVSQLEVVLANGDVMQTGRMGKRELEAKKGLPSMEGEIYRKLDALIDESQELITTHFPKNSRSTAGYSGIGAVKRDDGSFDLTPLIIGSQGTLGIVSEMIMRSEFVTDNLDAAILCFSNKESARDAIEAVRSLEPAFIDYYDAGFFDQAIERGRDYPFYTAARQRGPITQVMMVAFDDFNDRNRLKKLKKLVARMPGDVTILSSADVHTDDILAIRQATHYPLVPDDYDKAAVPILDGFYIPDDKFDDFALEISLLSDKYRMPLPIHGRALDNIYYIRPVLQLATIGGKQAVFRMLEEVGELIKNCGGELIAEGGEGRLKSRFAYKDYPEELKVLFTQVKNIFDPHGILNPEVKVQNEVKDIAPILRESYDLRYQAPYAPYY